MSSAGGLNGRRMEMSEGSSESSRGSGGSTSRVLTALDTGERTSLLSNMSDLGLTFRSHFHAYCHGPLAAYARPGWNL
jgi:hypothetical protein